MKLPDFEKIAKTDMAGETLEERRSKFIKEGIEPPTSFEYKPFNITTSSRLVFVRWWKEFLYWYLRIHFVLQVKYSMRMCHRKATAVQVFSQQKASSRAFPVWQKRLARASSICVQSKSMTKPLTRPCLVSMPNTSTAMLTMLSWSKIQIDVFTVHNSG